jgi:hypothetical protein
MNPVHIFTSILKLSPDSRLAPEMLLFFILYSLGAPVYHRRDYGTELWRYVCYG